MLSIGDGSSKRSSSGRCKYAHTLRHVFAVLGFARELLFQPVVNCRFSLGVAQLFRPKFPHNPYKLRTKIAANDTNAMASTQQMKSQSEEWGIIPADNSNIIADTASNHSTRCMNFASEVKGTKVWNPPVDVFDDGRWTAEGDREGKGLHEVVLGGFVHSASLGSSKSIDVLIWITDSNKSMFNKPFEHGMVNW